MKLGQCQSNIALRSQRVGRAPQLLRWPEPQDGESNFGYVLRLGVANRLAGFNAVLRALGVKPKEADKLGAHGVWLLCSSSLRNGSKERDRVLSVNRQNRKCLPTLLGRVCPKCLSDLGYSLAIWDEPYSFFCYPHNVRLTERCCCGRPISYRRRNLFKCVCGEDLRKARSDPAPAWARTFRDVLRSTDYRTAVQRMTRKNSTSDQLKGRALRAVINLALARSGELAPARSLGSRRVTEMEMDIIEELMSGWPASLGRLIGGKLGDLSVNRRGTFLSATRGAVATPLVIEIEKLAEVVRIEAMRARPAVAGAAAPSPDLASICEVASAYGVEYGHIRRLFDSGCFSGAAMSIDYGKTRYGLWVAKDELYLALAVRMQTMSVVEASRWFHCSAEYVHALLKVGYLPLSVLPRRLPGKRILVGSVRQFIDGLRARAISAGTDGDSLVALSSLIAMNDHILRKKWFILMERIRAREITLFALDDGSAGLMSFAVRAKDAVGCVEIRSHRRSAIARAVPSESDDMIGQL